MDTRSHSLDIVELTDDQVRAEPGRYVPIPADEVEAVKALSVEDRRIWLQTTPEERRAWLMANEERERELANRQARRKRKRERKAGRAARKRMRASQKRSK